MEVGLGNGDYQVPVPPVASKVLKKHKGDNYIFVKICDIWQKEYYLIQIIQSPANRYGY